MFFNLIKNKNISYSVLLLLLLISPYVFLYVHRDMHIGGFISINALLSFFFAFVFFSFTGMIRIISNMIYSLLYFCFILSVFSYKTFITISAISAIFESNLAESIGYFKQFGFIPLVISIVMTVIVFLCCCKIRLNNKTSQMALLFCVFFVALISKVTLSSARARYEAKEDYSSYLAGSYNSSIFGGIFNVLNYISDNFNSDSNSLIKPKYLTKGDVKYNHIYVIIGESSSKRHYSIYGYEKDTTPKLKSLVGYKSFTKYDDVISPTPTTRESLKRILSFATVENDNAYKEKINIVNLAKDNGYETYWISSQGNKGFYNNLISTIGNKADFHVYNLNDVELFKEVKEHYKSNINQVFFIHLDGSHAPYSNFDKEDVNGSNVNDFYDATIKRTDRILYDFIKYIDSQSSSIGIYFSDHGEVIGHGHGLDKATKEQYEIPLFVVDSSKNKTETKRIIDSMYKANLFNTDNLSEFLAYVFGYNLDFKKINIESKYILDSSNNKIDYYTLPNKYS